MGKFWLTARTPRQTYETNVRRVALGGPTGPRTKASTTMGCGSSSGCGCGSSGGKCGCKAAAAGGGGLLKFSGSVTGGAEAAEIVYLQDAGVSSDFALAYPVPIKRTFTGFAASLDVQPTGTVDVVLLKNGVATGLAVQFTATSDLQLLKAGSVVYNPGDTFDVRVTVSSGDTGTYLVKAVVGTK